MASAFSPSQLVQLPRSASQLNLPWPLGHLVDHLLDQVKIIGHVMIWRYPDACWHNGGYLAATASVDTLALASSDEIACRPVGIQQNWLAGWP